MTGDAAAGLADVRLEYVDSFAQAEALMRWLGERHGDEWALAFDTETGGLKPWRDPLRLVQVADSMTGWAIPFDGPGAWRGLVQEVFRRWTGEWVGHHSKFDQGFLETYAGVRFATPPHCTMLAARLMDSQASAALKALADRHVSPDASKGQRALKASMDAQGWGWGDVPLDYPIYWGYGALDAVLTARVGRVVLPQVPADAYELERACSPVLGRMELKGMRIDREYTATVGARLSAFVDERTALVTSRWGVSPTSNQQVARALLADGVELTERTDTGQWKLDKEVLERIATEHLGPDGVGHELATYVLEIRSARKVVGTYFINLMTDLDSQDRVHASINQAAARTSRMSVSEPALQTLPRGTMVRDCFIPADGHVLASVDADQIEMRLLAHFCRDPGLIEAIMTGDLHTATARLVYHDATIGKKDPRRQTAKNAGFAKVYGAGVEQFSRTAGVDVSEGRSFLDEYDRMFPGVPDFQRQVGHVVESRLRSEGRGYVVTPTGRRLHTDPRRSYTGVNYLIQGHAAEVLKRQIVELDAAGFGDMMLCPVHDELIFELPREGAAETLREIERTMTLSDYAVPITVSGDLLERWGDKYRD